MSVEDLISKVTSKDEGTQLHLYMHKSEGPGQSRAPIQLQYPPSRRA